MKNRIQDSGLKIRNSRIAFFLSCVLCLVFCVSSLSILYAQEEDEDKDRITDLPAVKIEVVDTTQINIPREKFRSFTMPDPGLYTPLSPKERPWYLPPTSVPEKLREETIESERDFLFSISAYTGVPRILAYQILLVRDFGNSEGLLDMGRLTLGDERTAEKQEDSNTDRFRGYFAHQGENFSLKADAQYNARELVYLGKADEELPNDRALTDFSVDWHQRLSDSARSSLNLKVSDLRMEGPLSSGDEKGLDIKAGVGVKASWPRSNPIETGLSVQYFNGENDNEDFKESILRLYFRDKYIRLWSFVLGVGAELVLDARRQPSEKNSEGKWETSIYPNPYLLVMSQIGLSTILKFRADGSILRQDLKDLYLEKNNVKFNPDLDMERAWNLDASLQYRLTHKFAMTIGAFGKEISNLNFFEKTDDEIVSWEPRALDSARIFGFTGAWELSLLDGKLKQNIEYIHEYHDQEGHIPYRPEDKGSLDITYYAPFGLQPSLNIEFYGTRYVDTEDDKTLSTYFLLKPRISKTFGRYASVFLGAGFYLGQDDYQIWEDYKLPSQTVDFGLTLKF